MINRLRCAPSVVWQQRRGQSGFTLFEFAVVVIIFGILVTVILERMAYYQYESEKAQVGLLLKNMRSALTGRQLEALMPSANFKLPELDGINPITLLQRKPDDYFGEVDKVSVESVPPGHWYFERDSRRVAYVFSGKKSFLGDSFERWYFKVKFTRLPTKHAKPDEGPELVGSVALIQVDEP